MPMSSPSSSPLLSALVFLAFLHVASSLHSLSPFPSPSPSPGPAAADDSPISSPPSPPPSETPSPAQAPPVSPGPTPDKSTADLSHTGVLDQNAGAGDKSEGLNGGSKAGVVLGVVVCAALVVVGGIVYRKRRENIRRQQDAYSGRGEIQL
ncbi:hypothetical protein MLD38_040160 [Melastoma candidum]|uniref:Uncharacterized protein n=1 Tax=Melastoma candidum TaxID=119954 RepID=A0ACB9L4I0_9MYRT|nr:hypothetical protein MLD38_040160 [Melastoma candidum]